MRHFEFKPLLKEYSREKTLDRYSDKLQIKSKEFGVDINQLMNRLELADPTKNKEYVPWLTLQLIRNQFALSDLTEVGENLSKFHWFKPRLKQKDINQYSYQQLETMINKFTKAEFDTHSEGGFPTIQNTHVLYNGPYGQLATGLTRKAMQKLGSGTLLCTGPDCDTWEPDTETPTPFNKIIDSLMMWRDRNGHKYQFLFNFDPNIYEDIFDPDNGVTPTIEARDEQDEPFTGEQWDQIFSHPVLSKMFARAEQELIAKNDALTLVALAGNKRSRIPKAEKIISQDSKAAYLYALYIIQGPWPAGEKTIYSDSAMSEYYQRYVLDSSS